jgi:hypothetical protein
MGWQMSFSGMSIIGEIELADGNKPFHFLYRSSDPDRDRASDLCSPLSSLTLPLKPCIRSLKWKSLIGFGLRSGAIICFQTLSSVDDLFIFPSSTFVRSVATSARLSSFVFLYLAPRKSQEPSFCTTTTRDHRHHHST